MKTLTYIYQENEIHFLVNPNDQNVMINATEMAKVFGKKVDNFTRLSSTEEFIQALLESENSKFDPSHVRDQIERKGLIYADNKATYMHRKLAIYFAMWLDIKFQVWVIDVIDDLVFGNYKKHWEAHAVQEAAKLKMEVLKERLLNEGSTEIARVYFEAERDYKSAKSDKVTAIRNQLKLFNLDPQAKTA